MRIEGKEGKVLKILQNQREIESALLNYNNNHFNKAKQSLTCEDRISKRLHYNSARKRC